MTKLYSFFAGEHSAAIESSQVSEAAANLSIHNVQLLILTTTLSIFSLSFVSTS